MARQFCALLLVFGLAAASVTLASPDAPLLGSPRIQPAAERLAAHASGPDRSQGRCGSRTVIGPAQPADLSVRLAAATMRVLMQLAQAPSLWLDRRGLDRGWRDELTAAMEDLRLCVLEAYGQAYSRVVGIGGIGS